MKHTLSFKNHPQYSRHNPQVMSNTKNIVRLMSKPSAQGSDPVHGWDFYYMFYISTSSSLLLSYRGAELLSLKIGFLLGWLHNKGTFSGPLIVRERCERSQQSIERIIKSQMRLRSIQLNWDSADRLAEKK